MFLFSLFLFFSFLLNNIIIINTICYTMFYMLEWMRKGKYKIGTSRTRNPTSKEESHKSYIFIV